LSIAHMIAFQSETSAPARCTHCCIRAASLLSFPSKPELGASKATDDRILSTRNHQRGDGQKYCFRGQNPVILIPSRLPRLVLNSGPLKKRMAHSTGRWQHLRTEGSHLCPQKRGSGHGGTWPGIRASYCPRSAHNLLGGRWLTQHRLQLLGADMKGDQACGSHPAVLRTHRFRCWVGWGCPKGADRRHFGE
jgi:hypothetical protein